MVAEFIAQSESATHIEEALKILISWNPNWKPNYFMTDYSEAEIAALETCFPGVTVLLCTCVISTESRPGSDGPEIANMA